MVSTGHYSTPFVPTYPGVEKFPGRVMHSHDFRDACEFEGKRLLVVSTMILLYFWDYSLYNSEKETKMYEL